MMKLTYQQKRLVKEKLKGKSNLEIGALFGLTEGTVRTYFFKIHKKLGVTCWREAVGKIREDENGILG